MRRLIAAAVFSVGTLGAIGCAGSAKLVQKSPDGTGAVISVKSTGDFKANAAEAMKLASKELGGEVTLVDTTQPNLTPPGAKPGAAPMEQTVMHYVFKKKSKTDVTGLPPAPGTGMPGGVGQAGYQGQPSNTGAMPGGYPISGTGMPSSGAGYPTSGNSGFGTGANAGSPPRVFPQSQ